MYCACGVVIQLWEYMCSEWPPQMAAFMGCKQPQPYPAHCPGTHAGCCIGSFLFPGEDTHGTVDVMKRRACASPPFPSLLHFHCQCPLVLFFSSPSSLPFPSPHCLTVYMYMSLHTHTLYSSLFSSLLPPSPLSLFLLPPLPLSLLPSFSTCVPPSLPPHQVIYCDTYGQE